MFSPHGDLAALGRRLQGIIRLPIDLDQLEDPGIDPTRSMYLCAECAWTTSANARALARHFIFKHTPRLKCPDCQRFCDNQEGLEKHRSQEHTNLCLACHDFFPTVNEQQQHDPCIKQQCLSPKIEDGASSLMAYDRSINGRAPASDQSTLNRKGSVQSGSCPHPGCQFTFSDFYALYEHYVGLHPLYLVYGDHPKPFKCPFCPKRYQQDRFVPGHVRTHKPKVSNGSGFRNAEDQEALILQSHVAVASRNPPLGVEQQARANCTSSDEEEEYSTAIKAEDEFSLVLKDGVIYIDDGVGPLSPFPGQSNRTDPHEPQRLPKTTPIGLVLQAISADICNSHADTRTVDTVGRASTTDPLLLDRMDLDDGYPERFALDDDELPPREMPLDSFNIAAHPLDGLFHQSLSGEIVRTLQMQHFINASEVVDLFTYFLDEYQRVYVLEQLASINLRRPDSGVLEELHGTMFKALIDAWVDFKRLAIRFAPQLIIQANHQKIKSGKSVTWALLQYCLSLENLIYRNEINIAHHFLRDPPLDHFVISMDAPFHHIVAALVERVKNRTVHDLAVVFTKEMILRELSDYVKILQMIFRPLYPLAAGHEPLWRELRLI